ncbi:hypothetical protein B6D52_02470 [Candidatus Parcubacteria bacterium 4484_255]|nr:MAG: hypothetical protein B6D52_02470 [Candidatus Parcubacteria bacterium 4484_255]
MTFEVFTRKPFKDRLKDTGFLIKNSFTIVGKDKDIKTPTIHMIIFSLIIIIFFYSTILIFISGKFVIIGVLLLLLTIFILIPFGFFYNVRQKADQSWMVYNTICGKDINYNDAHNHTKTEKGKLRIIAFVNILMKYTKNQKGNKKGIMALFLSFLNEVWDLLSHYMLPAVVIEQKPLKEIIPEIKSLKTNVPATLAGVFGIDFVGNVTGWLFGGIFFVSLLISVGIGYLISMFTEATVITIGSFSFSWVPVFIMLFLVSIIAGVYKKILESIKVIYFTIFYTSIMRPMNISQELRGELTNYLLMQKSDFALHQKPTPNQQYIDKLSNYIRQYENSGYSEQQIKQFLASKGYSERDINSAINNIK